MTQPLQRAFAPSSSPPSFFFLLRVWSLLVLFLSAPVSLQTRTRLANPKDAHRTMLRADPFFPALDVNICRSIPSRCIVSISRITSIALYFTTSRSPAMFSNRDGFGGPNQIIVFFDVLQTGAVPEAAFGT